MKVLGRSLAHNVPGIGAVAEFLALSQIENMPLGLY